MAGKGSPSDKFWALEKRICQDKRYPGVQLELRRSQLLSQLALLLNNGVITSKAPEGFSGGMLDALHFLTERKSE